MAKTKQPKGGSRERERKVVPFNHRVSADEKAAFEMAAKVAGLPLSAWVRERLRSASIRELQGAGLQIAFLHETDE